MSFYKSIVVQDRCAVVICNLAHEIIYMNPAAVLNYEKWGREKLIGRSLMECHNQASGEKIQQVVDWFIADDNYNIVYTFHNEKQNKDVYMVALRDDGKVLVILDVYKGDETPYYYSGDSVLEAFVRVGNESVKATANELKRLVLRGKNTSYDSQNSTYKMEDYAFSKIKERYKKWTGNSFDDKELISFGLVNEQGELTNVGALLADESPILCSRLFCTRWNGLNKSGGVVDALDDAEYTGSVVSLIENGEAFIKRNCKMKWRKTANSREEMPEYVERSYHEALVNALAHRDYLVNGSEVHIDIYDDRMEIYSPGGMPDGSLIQDRDPLTVPSIRRNPVLADVFNRLGYMERKGSGFGKIISGYEFQINYSENKRPSFRSDRYQFTVVMPNLNYDVPQDVPQGVPQDKLDVQIIDLIRKDNKISTEKIAIALGVSSKTIKRHIKEMDNVNYYGRGFSGHWEIKDNE